MLIYVKFKLSLFSKTNIENIEKVEILNKMLASLLNADMEKRLSEKVLVLSFVLSLSCPFLSSFQAEYIGHK